MSLIYYLNCSLVQRIATQSAALTFIPRRFRYKPKWATYRRKKSPSEYALDHFDNYYEPVYGSLWPSLRLALLSQQKYCALVNNFADADDQVIDLIADGADDVLHIASSRELNDFEKEHMHKHNKSLDDRINQVVFRDAELLMEEDKFLNPPPASSDLHRFMSDTELVITSERQLMREQEVEQNIYRPTGIDINIVPGEFPVLPFHFKALMHGMGNIDLFPPPKRGKTGKLAYYLMDAASLLPVLALGLEPGCDVLDLCAAPGGKSLAILQTLLSEHLYCVDHSWSRIKRMKTIFRDYLPKSYMHDGMVEIFHSTGSDFVKTSVKKFDRVLVDVPCFTDRHVLHEDENNIFRPSRLSDRLQIQNKQQNLLYAGIQSCKPGGAVVYSTCTLAPPQNDGVIQAVLERVWQDTNIDLVIEDMKMFSLKFKDIFHFYDKCRFGQLVIPKLTANFGPIYFCKMRRLN